MTFNDFLLAPFCALAKPYDLTALGFAVWRGFSQALWEWWFKRNWRRKPRP